MSRMKLVCASATSVALGVGGGVWWERRSKSYDDERRPIIPTLHAATVQTPAIFGTRDGGRLDDISQSLTSKGSPQMRFGFPTIEQLKWRNDYVLSYDRKHRTAYWVFEHLTPESCTKRDDVERKDCHFTIDPSVHPFFQSSHVDYKHSGFDRGHLAAAGNHRATPEQCQETFFYSNMAPQVGEGFNRGAWNSLEKLIRSMARKNPHVFVMTGPLYLPRQEPDGRLFVKYQVIGPNQVAVPTHFFKVAVVQTSAGAYELHSFVLPNQYIAESTPLPSFYVPIETVERSAGFLLFEKIPRNSFQSVNGVATKGARLALSGG